MINAAGLDIIRRYESCRLQAYLCPAGVWTIGWGHTGDHVHEGLVITRHQADEVLMSDVDRFDSGVADLAPNANENQHSAMVSFAFNCGLAALARSTLLKRFHEGKFHAAAAEFGQWRYARGAVLPGLEKRRAEEAALFLAPVKK